MRFAKRLLLALCLVAALSGFAFATTQVQICNDATHASNELCTSFQEALNAISANPESYGSTQLVLAPGVHTLTVNDAASNTALESSRCLYQLPAGLEITATTQYSNTTVELNVQSSQGTHVAEYALFCFLPSTNQKAFYMTTETVDTSLRMIFNNYISQLKYFIAALPNKDSGRMFLDSNIGVHGIVLENIVFKSGASLYPPTPVTDMINNGVDNVTLALPLNNLAIVGCDMQKGGAVIEFNDLKTRHDGDFLIAGSTIHAPAADQITAAWTGATIRKIYFANTYKVATSAQLENALTQCAPASTVVLTADITYTGAANTLCPYVKIDGDAYTVERSVDVPIFELTHNNFDLIDIKLGSVGSLTAPLVKFTDAAVPTYASDYDNFVLTPGTEETTTGTDVSSLIEYYRVQVRLFGSGLTKRFILSDVASNASIANGILIDTIRSLSDLQFEVTADLTNINNLFQVTRYDAMSDIEIEKITLAPAVTSGKTLFSVATGASLNNTAYVVVDELDGFDTLATYEGSTDAKLIVLVKHHKDDNNEHIPAKVTIASTDYTIRRISDIESWLQFLGEAVAPMDVKIGSTISACEVLAKYPLFIQKGTANVINTTTQTPSLDCADGAKKYMIAGHSSNLKFKDLTMTSLSSCIVFLDKTPVNETLTGFVDWPIEEYTVAQGLNLDGAVVGDATTNEVHIARPSLEGCTLEAEMVGVHVWHGIVYMKQSSVYGEDYAVHAASSTVTSTSTHFLGSTDDNGHHAVYVRGGSADFTDAIIKTHTNVSAIKTESCGDVSLTRVFVLSDEQPFEVNCVDGGLIEVVESVIKSDGVVDVSAQVLGGYTPIDTTRFSAIDASSAGSVALNSTELSYGAQAGVTFYVYEFPDAAPVEINGQNKPVYGMVMIKPTGALNPVITATVTVPRSALGADYVLQLYKVTDGAPTPLGYDSITVTTNSVEMTKQISSFSTFFAAPTIKQIQLKEDCTGVDAWLNCKTSVAAVLAEIALDSSLDYEITVFGKNSAYAVSSIGETSGVHHGVLSSKTTWTCDVTADNTFFCEFEHAAGGTERNNVFELIAGSEGTSFTDIRFTQSAVMRTYFNDMVGGEGVENNGIGALVKIAGTSATAPLTDITFSGCRFTNADELVHIERAFGIAFTNCIFDNSDLAATKPHGIAVHYVLNQYPEYVDSLTLDETVKFTGNTFDSFRIAIHVPIEESLDCDYPPVDAFVPPFSIENNDFQNGMMSVYASESNDILPRAVFTLSGNDHMMPFMIPNNRVAGSTVTAAAVRLFAPKVSVSDNFLGGFSAEITCMDCVFSSDMENAVGGQEAGVLVFHFKQQLGCGFYGRREVDLRAEISNARLDVSHLIVRNELSGYMPVSFTNVHFEPSTVKAASSVNAIASFIGGDAIFSDIISCTGCMNLLGSAIFANRKSGEYYDNGLPTACPVGQVPDQLVPTKCVSFASTGMNAIIAADEIQFCGVGQVANADHTVCSNTAETDFVAARQESVLEFAQATEGSLDTISGDVADLRTDVGLRTDIQALATQLGLEGLDQSLVKIADAVHTQVGLVEARVSTAEGKITTVEGSIGTLNNEMSALRGIVLANSSTLETVKSLATANKDTLEQITHIVNDHSADLTQIETIVNANDGELDAIALMLNTSAPGNVISLIGAEGARITVLEGAMGPATAIVDFAQTLELATAKQNVAGMFEALILQDTAFATTIEGLGQLYASVGSVQLINDALPTLASVSSVEDVSTDLTTLAGRVSTLEATSATSAALGTLSTQVSTIDTKVTALGVTSSNMQTTIGTLATQSSVNALQATVSTLASADSVTALTTRVSDAESEIQQIWTDLASHPTSGTIQDIQTRLGSIEGLLDTNADGSVADKVEDVRTAFGDTTMMPDIATVVNAPGADIVTVLSTVATKTVQADTKAIAAQTAAQTADAKAVTADTKAVAAQSTATQANTRAVDIIAQLNTLLAAVSGSNLAAATTDVPDLAPLIEYFNLLESKYAALTGETIRVSKMAGEHVSDEHIYIVGLYSALTILGAALVLGVLGFAVYWTIARHNSSKVANEESELLVDGEERADFGGFNATRGPVGAYF